MDDIKDLISVLLVILLVISPFLADRVFNAKER